jgi:hypothetical protein
MIRSRQVFALKAKTRARKAQLARCWLVGGALFVLQTFTLDTAKSQELKINTLKQITFHKMNYTSNNSIVLMRLYGKNHDGTTKQRILSQVHLVYFKYLNQKTKIQLNKLIKD